MSKVLKSWMAALAFAGAAATLPVAAGAQDAAAAPSVNAPAARAGTAGAVLSGPTDATQGVTPPSATVDATKAQQATDAKTAAPAWQGAKPVAGVGQPVDAGITFQPTVTPIGERGHFLNNVVLMPIITVVTLLVLGLMLWVMVRYNARANPVPSKTSHNTMIEVLWTAIPALVLLAVAFPSLKLLAAQYKPASADALTIKVTGYQWNWGYAYPDQEIGEYISKLLPEDQAKAKGEPYLLAVDKRMVVPVNRQVKLIITGADVIHSFAVPALWTKMDAVPGRANETTFTATKTGVYYGQCSELCGVDHGFMPIAVEVVTAEQFDAWVRANGGKTAGDLAAAKAAEAAGSAVPAAGTGTATTPAPAPATKAEAAAVTPAAPAPAAAAPAAATTH